jgi:Transmembrane secretion effector
MISIRKPVSKALAGNARCKHQRRDAKAQRNGRTLIDQHLWLSIFMIVSGGMMAMGSAAWGVAADFAGIPWTFAASAFCLFAFGLRGDPLAHTRG